MFAEAAPARNRQTDALYAMKRAKIVDSSRTPAIGKL